MNVQQEKRNARNAVNWDIAQNVADQPGRLTILQTKKLIVQTKTIGYPTEYTQFNKRYSFTQFTYSHTLIGNKKQERTTVLY